MMLDHIGERERGAHIRAALGRILAAGQVRTRDLGGQASTTEFTEAICKEIEWLACSRLRGSLLAVPKPSAAGWLAAGGYVAERSGWQQLAASRERLPLTPASSDSRAPPDQTDIQRVADERVANRHFVEMRQRSGTASSFQIEIVTGVDADAEAARERRSGDVETEAFLPLPRPGRKRARTARYTARYDRRRLTPPIAPAPAPARRRRSP